MSTECQRDAGLACNGWNETRVQMSDRFTYKVVSVSIERISTIAVSAVMSPHTTIHLSHAPQECISNTDCYE